jgi:hypothetical protein
MNDRPQERPLEEHAGLGESPLSELQSLLDRQIAEARRGNFSAVYALADQSGQLVERLTSGGTAETTGFKAQQAAVQDSYRKLMLMLAAARQDVDGQLSSIGQGKKLVRVYRRNSA